MAMPLFLGHIQHNKLLSHTVARFVRYLSTVNGPINKTKLYAQYIPVKTSAQHKKICFLHVRTGINPLLSNKFYINNGLCTIFGCQVRYMSQQRQTRHKGNLSYLIYVCAIGVFMLGMSYAGVPLYRMFCQAAGLGGQATKGHDFNKVETMTPVKDRLLKIRFNADVASSMRWNFRPQQSEVKVMPGETALAFYKAKNPTDKPIIGISTYNVLPFEAGQYFNKIQCFCFEEQMLNPNEEVDMPVFFFIDPEYAQDPKLQNVDTIILSYTFFEAKEGMSLPRPAFATS